MHPDDKSPDTAPFMLARGWDYDSPQDSWATPIEQPSQPEPWEIVDRIVFRSILVFIAALATIWGLITPAVIYGPSVIPTALFPMALIWGCVAAVWAADNREHGKRTK